MLEKATESLLDCKQIQPVHPKGNQSWIFIGRTDAEAEAPILWPPDVKSRLIRRDLDAGKDWRQEEKGMTEDEMVGWHQWLNGPEFKQALGDAKGQRSLACCSPWSHKEWEAVIHFLFSMVCLTTSNYHLLLYFMLTYNSYFLPCTFRIWAIRVIVKKSLHPWWLAQYITTEGTQILTE